MVDLWVSLGLVLADQVGEHDHGWFICGLLKFDLILMGADAFLVPGRPMPVLNYRGRSLTVFVGKIPPTMDADTMKEILGHCGSLKNYKSYIDTTKGFCIATFASPQGVYLAEKLLHGLVIDGQALIVKCNKSTEQLLSNLKNEKSTLNEPVVPEDVESTAKGRIEEVVKGRKKIAQNEVDKSTEASAAAVEFLSSLHSDVQSQDKVEVVPPRKARKTERRPTIQRPHWKDALRTLEKNERERLKRHEIETDKLRDLAQERQRQILADNEGVDPREKQPIHLRKMCRNTRERTERLKQNEKELQEDKAEEERMKKEHASKMDKEMKAAVESKPEPLKVNQASKKGGAVFDEEDVQTKEKKFIPIQYSKEEMAVGRDRKSRSQIEAINRSIVDNIPRTIDDLEHYVVKWEYFDAAGKDVQRKMKSWIGKKIKDLMGEEEESFCDFIYQQIVSHKSPKEFVDSLQEVLDEDTEPFVIKLFGVIIFETERFLNGI